MAEQVIWHANDEKNEYKPQVVRTGPRTGEFQFIRISDGEILYKEEVPLAYGAMFGPDIDDAEQWMVMAYTILSCITS